MKSIYINDASKVKVLYPEYYEFDYADHKLPLGIISKYHVKTTFKATAHITSNHICLLFSRLYEYLFAQMNHLTLD